MYHGKQNHSDVENKDQARKSKNVDILLLSLNAVPSSFEWWKRTVECYEEASVYAEVEYREMVQKTQLPLSLSQLSLEASSIIGEFNETVTIRVGTDLVVWRSEMSVPMQLERSGTLDFLKFRVLLSQEDDVVPKVIGDQQLLVQEALERPGPRSLPISDSSGEVIARLVININPNLEAAPIHEGGAQFSSISKTRGHTEEDQFQSLFEESGSNEQVELSQRSSSVSSITEPGSKVSRGQKVDEELKMLLEQLRANAAKAATKESDRYIVGSHNEPGSIHQAQDSFPRQSDRQVLSQHALESKMRVDVNKSTGQVQAILPEHSSERSFQAQFDSTNFGIIPRDLPILSEPKSGDTSSSHTGELSDLLNQIQLSDESSKSQKEAPVNPSNVQPKLPVSLEEQHSTNSGNSESDRSLAELIKKIRLAEMKTMQAENESVEGAVTSPQGASLAEVTHKSPGSSPDHLEPNPITADLSLSRVLEDAAKELQILQRHSDQDHGMQPTELAQSTLSISGIQEGKESKNLGMVQSSRFPAAVPGQPVQLAESGEWDRILPTMESLGLETFDEDSSQRDWSFLSPDWKFLDSGKKSRFKDDEEGEGDAERTLISKVEDIGTQVEDAQGHRSSAEESPAVASLSQRQLSEEGRIEAEERNNNRIQTFNDDTTASPPKESSQEKAQKVEAEIPRSHVADPLAQRSPHASVFEQFPLPNPSNAQSGSSEERLSKTRRESLAEDKRSKSPESLLDFGKDSLSLSHDNRTDANAPHTDGAHASHLRTKPESLLSSSVDEVGTPQTTQGTACQTEQNASRGGADVSSQAKYVAVEGSMRNPESTNNGSGVFPRKSNGDLDLDQADDLLDRILTMASESSAASPDENAREPEPPPNKPKPQLPPDAKDTEPTFEKTIDLVNQVLARASDSTTPTSSHASARHPESYGSVGFVHAQPRTTSVDSILEETTALMNQILARPSDSDASPSSNASTSRNSDVPVAVTNDIARSKERLGFEETANLLNQILARASDSVSSSSANESGTRKPESLMGSVEKLDGPYEAAGNYPDRDQFDHLPSRSMVGSSDADAMGSSDTPPRFTNLERESSLSHANITDESIAKEVRGSSVLEDKKNETQEPGIGDDRSLALQQVEDDSGRVKTFFEDGSRSGSLSSHGFTNLEREPSYIQTDITDGSAAKEARGSSVLAIRRSETQEPEIGDDRSLVLQQVEDNLGRVQAFLEDASQSGSLSSHGFTNLERKSSLSQHTDITDESSSKEATRSSVLGDKGSGTQKPGTGDDQPLALQRVADNSGRGQAFLEDSSQSGSLSSHEHMSVMSSSLSPPLETSTSGGSHGNHHKLSDLSANGQLGLQSLDPGHRTISSEDDVSAMSSPFASASFGGASRPESERFKFPPAPISYTLPSGDEEQRSGQSEAVVLAGSSSSSTFDDLQQRFTNNLQTSDLEEGGYEPSSGPDSSTFGPHGDGGNVVTLSPRKSPSKRNFTQLTSSISDSDVQNLFSTSQPETLGTIDIEELLEELPSSADQKSMLTESNKELGTQSPPTEISSLSSAGYTRRSSFNDNKRMSRHDSMSPEESLKNLPGQEVPSEQYPLLSSSSSDNHQGDTSLKGSSRSSANKVSQGLFSSDLSFGVSSVSAHNYSSSLSKFKNHQNSHSPEINKKTDSPSLDSVSEMSSLTQEKPFLSPDARSPNNLEPDQANEDSLSALSSLPGALTSPGYAPSTSPSSIAPKNERGSTTRLFGAGTQKGSLSSFSVPSTSETTSGTHNAVIPGSYKSFVFTDERISDHSISTPSTPPSNEFYTVKTSGISPTHDQRTLEHSLSTHSHSSSSMIDYSLKSSKILTSTDERNDHSISTPALSSSSMNYSLNSSDNSIIKSNRLHSLSTFNSSGTDHLDALVTLPTKTNGIDKSEHTLSSLETENHSLGTGPKQRQQKMFMIPDSKESTSHGLSDLSLDTTSTEDKGMNEYDKIQDVLKQLVQPNRREGYSHQLFNTRSEPNLKYPAVMKDPNVQQTTSQQSVSTYQSSFGGVTTRGSTPTLSSIEEKGMEEFDHIQGVLATLKKSERDPPFLEEETDPQWRHKHNPQNTNKTGHSVDVTSSGEESSTLFRNLGQPQKDKPDPSMQTGHIDPRPTAHHGHLHPIEEASRGTSGSDSKDSAVPAHTQNPQTFRLLDGTLKKRSPLPLHNKSSQTMPLSPQGIQFQSPPRRDISSQTTVIDPTEILPPTPPRRKKASKAISPRQKEALKQPLPSNEEGFPESISSLMQRLATLADKYGQDHIKEQRYREDIKRRFLSYAMEALNKKKMQKASSRQRSDIPTMATTTGPAAPMLGNICAVCHGPATPVQVKPEPKSYCAYCGHKLKDAIKQPETAQPSLVNPKPYQKMVGSTQQFNKRTKPQAHNSRHQGSDRKASLDIPDNSIESLLWGMQKRKIPDAQCHQNFPDIEDQSLNSEINNGSQRNNRKSKFDLFTILEGQPKLQHSPANSESEDQIWSYPAQPTWLEKRQKFNEKRQERFLANQERRHRLVREMKYQRCFHRHSRPSQPTSSGQTKILQNRKKCHPFKAVDQSRPRMRECIMKPGFVKVQWPVEDKEEKMLYLRLSREGCCHDRSRAMKKKIIRKNPKQQRKRRVTFAYEKKDRHHQNNQKEPILSQKRQKTSNPVALDNLLRTPKNRIPLRQGAAVVPKNGRNGNKKDSVTKFFHLPPTKKISSQNNSTQLHPLKLKKAQEKPRNKARMDFSESKLIEMLNDGITGEDFGDHKNKWIQSRLQKELDKHALKESPVPLENEDPSNTWAHVPSTALDTEIDQLAEALFLQPRSHSKQPDLSSFSSNISSSLLKSNTSPSSLDSAKLSEEISSSSHLSSNEKSVERLLGAQTMSGGDDLGTSPSTGVPNDVDSEEKRYGARKNRMADEDTVDINGTRISFSDLEAELWELEHGYEKDQVQVKAHDDLSSLTNGGQKEWIDGTRNPKDSMEALINNKDIFPSKDDNHFLTNLLDDDPSSGVTLEADVSFKENLEDSQEISNSRGSSISLTNLNAIDLLYAHN